MGRGKRKKKSFNPFPTDDDSSDDDFENKKCKQGKLKSEIPSAPLPPPPPAGIASLTKPLSTTSKENIAELTIVSNVKQGKTATASAVLTATSTKQNKFMQQIINNRQRAAEKALQRKKAMSLENIHKLSVRKKVIDSRSCCEAPVKVLESGGNYKSASQSSSILSPLNSQSVEQSLSDESQSEKSNEDKRDCRSHKVSETLLKTASASIPTTDISKFSNKY
jgi:hypothetical protein